MNIQPMSSLREPSSEILQQAIPQLEEPVVFKNLLRDSDGKNLWKFLDWNLTTFADKLGNLELPFRIGINDKTSEPQWDFKCKVENMTMKKFLQTIGSSSKNYEWYYFDYKYMHEWFSNHSEILSSIDWQRFGFNKQGEDSTLWIGSQGAHTNCHQDSYGCNLVAQIHGRKRWLLFPPDSGLDLLCPTRIPYEESTVYSSFNFFCPSKDDVEGILKIDPKARMVVLQPGEVLLVPKGWWHYVESIDLSVSVNVWLPLPSDHQSRLGEAVVKLIVNDIGKGLISATDTSLCSSNEIVRLVKTCIDQCNDIKDVESPQRKKNKSTNWSARELVDEYSTSISLIPVLKTEELHELLSENRIRFSNRNKSSDVETPNTVAEENIDSTEEHMTNVIINALCHPNVIAKVTELILYSNSIK